MVTMDYREDRIRVFVQDGVVDRCPKLGQYLCYSCHFATMHKVGSKGSWGLATCIVVDNFF